MGYFIHEHGIEASQFTTARYGKTRLLVPNKSRKELATESMELVISDAT